MTLSYCNFSKYSRYFKIRYSLEQMIPSVTLNLERTMEITNAYCSISWVTDEKSLKETVTKNYLYGTFQQEYKSPPCSGADNTRPPRLERLIRKAERRSRRKATSKRRRRRRPLLGQRALFHFNGPRGPGFH